MPVGCLWASTAVRFRAVVLLLLIVVPIVGFCNCSMFCCAYFVSYTSFAVILMGKRGLVALLCLSSRDCCVAIILTIFYQLC